MATNSQLTVEMKESAKSRLDALRHKSYGELSTMPVEKIEDIDILGKHIRIRFHLTPLGENGLLVVVQAMRQRYFGIFTQTHVEAFISKSNGEQSDAPKELLWPYI